MKDYQKSFELNQNSWDRRTPIHIDSHFYDNIGFFEGRNSLKHIELKLLGNVKENPFFTYNVTLDKIPCLFQEWALK